MMFFSQAYGESIAMPKIVRIASREELTGENLKTLSILGRKYGHEFYRNGKSVSVSTFVLAVTLYAAFYERFWELYRRFNRAHGVLEKKLLARRPDALFLPVDLVAQRDRQLDGVWTTILDTFVTKVYTRLDVFLGRQFAGWWGQRGKSRIRRMLFRFEDDAGLVELVLQTLRAHELRKVNGGFWNRLRWRRGRAARLQRDLLSAPDHHREAMRFLADVVLAQLFAHYLIEPKTDVLDFANAFIDTVLEELHTAPPTPAE